MNLFRLLVFAGSILVLGSCNKSPKGATSVASQEVLARAALSRILEANLPASATKVEHSSETLMTRVEDVRFECSDADFKSFWEGSAKLSELRPFRDLPAISTSVAEILDASWPASGGTQFCQIEVGREASGAVVVIIKTTHEQNR